MQSTLQINVINPFPGLGSKIFPVPFERACWIWPRWTYFKFLGRFSHKFAKIKTSLYDWMAVLRTRWLNKTSHIKKCHSFIIKSNLKVRPIANERGKIGDFFEKKKKSVHILYMDIMTMSYGPVELSQNVHVWTFFFLFSKKSPLFPFSFAIGLTLKFCLLTNL